MLNFESVHQAIPEGAHDGVPTPADGSTASSQGTSDLINWAIPILPYAEQQALFDQYDNSLPNKHVANLPVLRTPLSFFKCPSDSEVPLLMVPTQLASDVSPEGIATASCKGVSGTRWGATNGFFDYVPLQNNDECMRLIGNRHWYCDRAYASLLNAEKIPAHYRGQQALRFQVPVGGTEAANFALTTKPTAAAK